jgi:hypothetical protein
MTFGLRAAIERDQYSRGARGDHYAGKQRIAHQRSVSQPSHRSNPSCDSQQSNLLLALSAQKGTDDERVYLGARA